MFDFLLQFLVLYAIRDNIILCFRLDRWRNSRHEGVPQRRDGHEQTLHVTARRDSQTQHEPEHYVPPRDPSIISNVPHDNPHHIPQKDCIATQENKCRDGGAVLASHKDERVVFRNYAESYGNNAINLPQKPAVSSLQHRDPHSSEERGESSHASQSSPYISEHHQPGRQRTKSDCEKNDSSLHPKSSPFAPTDNTTVFPPVMSGGNTVPSQTVHLTPCEGSDHSASKDRHRYDNNKPGDTTCLLKKTAAEEFLDDRERISALIASISHDKSPTHHKDSALAEDIEPHTPDANPVEGSAEIMDCNDEEIVENKNVSIPDIVSISSKKTCLLSESAGSLSPMHNHDEKKDARDENSKRLDTTSTFIEERKENLNEDSHSTHSIESASNKTSSQMAKADINRADSVSNNSASKLRKRRRSEPDRETKKHKKDQTVENNEPTPAFDLREKLKHSNKKSSKSDQIVPTSGDKTSKDTKDIEKPLSKSKDRRKTEDSSVKKQTRKTKTEHTDAENVSKGKEVVKKNASGQQKSSAKGEVEKSVKTHSNHKVSVELSDFERLKAYSDIAHRKGIAQKISDKESRKARDHLIKRNSLKSKEQKSEEEENELPAKDEVQQDMTDKKVPRKGDAGFRISKEESICKENIHTPERANSPALQASEMPVSKSDSGADAPAAPAPVLTNLFTVHKKQQPDNLLQILPASKNVSQKSHAEETISENVIKILADAKKRALNSPSAATEKTEKIVKLLMPNPLESITPLKCIGNTPGEKCILTPHSNASSEVNHIMNMLHQQTGKKVTAREVIQPPVEKVFPGKPLPQRLCHSKQQSGNHNNIIQPQPSATDPHRSFAPMPNRSSSRTGSKNTAVARVTYDKQRDPRLGACPNAPPALLPGARLAKSAKPAKLETGVKIKLPTPQEIANAILAEETDIDMDTDRIDSNRDEVGEHDNETLAETINAEIVRESASEKEETHKKERNYRKTKSRMKRSQDKINLSNERASLNGKTSDKPLAHYKIPKKKVSSKKQTGSELEREKTNVKATDKNKSTDLCDSSASVKASDKNKNIDVCDSSASIKAGDKNIDVCDSSASIKASDKNIDVCDSSASVKTSDKNKNIDVCDTSASVKANDKNKNIDVSDSSASVNKSSSVSEESGFAKNDEKDSASGSVDDEFVHPSSVVHPEKSVSKKPAQAPITDYEGLMNYAVGSTPAYEPTSPDDTSFDNSLLGDDVTPFTFEKEDFEKSDPDASEAADPENSPKRSETSLDEAELVIADMDVSYSSSSDESTIVDAEENRDANEDNMITDANILSAPEKLKDSSSDSVVKEEPLSPPNVTNENSVTILTSGDSQMEDDTDVDILGLADNDVSTNMDDTFVSVVVRRTDFTQLSSLAAANNEIKSEQVGESEGPASGCQVTAADRSSPDLALGLEMSDFSEDGASDQCENSGGEADDKTHKGKVNSQIEVDQSATSENEEHEASENNGVDLSATLVENKEHETLKNNEVDISETSEKEEHHLSENSEDDKSETFESDEYESSESSSSDSDSSSSSDEDDDDDSESDQSHSDNDAVSNSQASSAGPSDGYVLVPDTQPGSSHVKFKKHKVDASTSVEDNEMIDLHPADGYAALGIDDTTNDEVDFHKKRELVKRKATEVCIRRDSVEEDVLSSIKSVDSEISANIESSEEGELSDSLSPRKDLRYRIPRRRKNEKSKHSPTPEHLDSGDSMRRTQSGRATRTSSIRRRAESPRRGDSRVRNVRPRSRSRGRERRPPSRSPVRRNLRSPRSARYARDQRTETSHRKSPPRRGRHRSTSRGRSSKGR